MTLTVNSIKKGIVLDHIKAGLGVKIFHYLGLEKADYTVALIINAPSKKYGKKDIIKIENVIDLDYTVLGLLDPNITVNIIEDEVVNRKIKMSLPDVVEGIIKCKNPRCITSTEKYAEEKFFLVDEEKAEYRCSYCDEIYTLSELLG